jgi:hypothetical protein
MTLKRRMLFSATAAILALSTASALAGDWSVGVSFGYGRSYYRPCYPRTVYYDYAPAVVYRDYDYCPDVVTYAAPRAYYYDSYYPRAVVYRDYPRYYAKTAFVSRGYYPSHHYTYRAPAYHSSYRAPAYHGSYRGSDRSPQHYRSSGPSGGYHRR